MATFLVTLTSPDLPQPPSARLVSAPRVCSASQGGEKRGCGQDEEYGGLVGALLAHHLARLEPLDLEPAVPARPLPHTLTFPQTQNDEDGK